MVLSVIIYVIIGIFLVSYLFKNKEHYDFDIPNKGFVIDYFIVGVILWPILLIYFILKQIF